MPAFDAAAARTLYAETLGGVADGLEGATELTVVPSGRLLSVPFQMLIADAATGPATADTAYLVKKFAITHVPSAANLVRLREASVKAGDPSSRRWFGFGASRSEEHTSELQSH